MKLKTIKTVSSLLLFASATSSYATTGYFSLGYGPKSSAMAGAVVAAPQDAPTLSLSTQKLNSYKE